MDVIPDYGVYMIMLAFGAVAVAVHAFTLYDKPLPHSQGQAIPEVLDGVALAYLGGARSYNTGLLCYLAISELLYLLLSSSSAILELSLNAVGGDGTVGAMTLDDTELNPLTPILASSVIMTIGQIKPFSQVEHAIRRISPPSGRHPRRVCSTC